VFYKKYLPWNKFYEREELEMAIKIPGSVKRSGEYKQKIIL
jgi:hypothetical protein